MLGEIWIYCILGISWPRSPGWILGSMWIYIDLHDLVTRVRPIAVSRVAWNFCFTMAFSICQLSFIILFISIASIRVYYIYIPIYLFIYHHDKISPFMMIKHSFALPPAHLSVPQLPQEQPWPPTTLTTRPTENLAFLRWKWCNQGFFWNIPRIVFLVSSPG